MEKYERNFNLTVGVDELLQNLRKTGILFLDNLGNYLFSYPYIYYFFAAKYFADNAADQSDTIDEILGSLHVDENAYIAVFISHHDNDKNSKVLEKIVSLALGLFEKHEPATLSQQELVFFDERIDEVVEAALPMITESAEHFREEELRVKDEIERGQWPK